MGTVPSSEAELTLAEVSRLRQRTHIRAHAGAWLPAVAIATILLGSAVLYRYPFAQTPSGRMIVIDYPFWAGLPDIQRSALASYLFWFLGTPLLLAVIGLWYRCRARRTGLRVAWRVIVGTGLGVLLSLAVLAAVPVREVTVESFTVGYQAAAGLRAVLTPLLALAVVVIVLGVVERSTGLAVAGAWIAFLAMWQCGYAGMGGVPRWFVWLLSGGDDDLPGGWGDPAGQLTLLGIDRPGPTLIIMAVPLLAVAAVRALRARRTVRAGETGRAGR